MNNVYLVEATDHNSIMDNFGSLERLKMSLADFVIYQENKIKQLEEVKKETIDKIKKQEDKFKKEYTEVRSKYVKDVENIELYVYNNTEHKFVIDPEKKSPVTNIVPISVDKKEPEPKKQIKRKK